MLRAEGLGLRVREHCNGESSRKAGMLQGEKVVCIYCSLFGDVAVSNIKENSMFYSVFIILTQQTLFQSWKYPSVCHIPQV